MEKERRKNRNGERRRRETKQKRKGNKKADGRRVIKINLENIEKKAYTEVTSCIQRLDLGYYVKAEDQRFCQITQNKHKTIRYNISEHLDQS